MLINNYTIPQVLISTTCSDSRKKSWWKFPKYFQHNFFLESKLVVEDQCDSSQALSSATNICQWMACRVVVLQSCQDSSAPRITLLFTRWSLPRLSSASVCSTNRGVLAGFEDPSVSVVPSFFVSPISSHNLWVYQVIALAWLNSDSHSAALSTTKYAQVESICHVHKTSAWWCFMGSEFTISMYLFNLMFCSCISSWCTCFSLLWVAAGLQSWDELCLIRDTFDEGVWVCPSFSQSHNVDLAMLRESAGCDIQSGVSCRKFKPESLSQLDESEHSALYRILYSYIIAHMHALLSHHAYQLVNCDSVASEMKCHFFWVHSRAACLSGECSIVVSNLCLMILGVSQFKILNYKVLNLIDVEVICKKCLCNLWVAITFFKDRPADPS